MPLDFVEQDKAQGPVILFNADSKARPQHLETEVLPNLISKVRQGAIRACSAGFPPPATRARVTFCSAPTLRSCAQVGDEKSQRVARWMVEKYLERNVLIFDPKVLEDMFLEADYKKEGSLDTRALAIAIMGERWQGVSRRKRSSAPACMHCSSAACMSKLHKLHELSCPHRTSSVPVCHQLAHRLHTNPPALLGATHVPSACTHPERSTCTTGRFPKRKLTKEWRQLVSLLLGIPELILTSDIVHTKVAKNVGHGGGVGMGLAETWQCFDRPARERLLCASNTLDSLRCIGASQKPQHSWC